MTLFYCTTDQVLVSSICVNFACRQFASIFVGVMPLLEFRILEIQFSTLFSYMLWHIELQFCIWLCFTVLQIKCECCQFASIFVGIMPLLELRILKIQFSALFSYMLWHIELKFCIWLCLMNYISSLSVFTLCPSIFCTFLLDALTNLAEI